jgi:hypothetical protein
VAEGLQFGQCGDVVTKKSLRHFNFLAQVNLVSYVQERFAACPVLAATMRGYTAGLHGFPGAKKFPGVAPSRLI